MRTTTKHSNPSSSLDKGSMLTALGIGFLWSWVYCAYNTPSLFHARTGNGSLAHPSWLVAIAGAILVLVVGAALFNKMRDPDKRLERLAAALMAVGSLLLATTAHPLLPMAGGFASGVGDGLLWLFWGRILVGIHSERTEYIVPASSIVTVAASLVYPSLSGIAGAAAVAVLPLLSLACLALVQQELSQAWGVAQEKDAPRPPMPTRDILYVIIYTVGVYFVIGCLNSLSPLSETAVGPFIVSVPVFLGSCLGVFLAMLCILYAVRIDLSSLSKVIAPLLMGAIALFASRNVVADQLSIVLLAGADFMATSVTIVYLVSLEKSGRLKGYSGIGIAQGALLIGSAAGNSFGRQWHDSFNLSEGQLLLIVLVLASVLILSLSFVPRGVLAPASPSQPSPDQREGDLTEIVQILAAERGITPRETEILGYLARGRTEPYIREQLWLSRSTVSTHVKHIYQKLDIHSKQEIISLIEAKRECN